jgi:hypothetical protein
MEDELLKKELRSKLNFAAADQGWADRWKDICINVLFIVMVLASLAGLTYVFSHH